MMHFQKNIKIILILQEILLLSYKRNYDLCVFYSWKF